MLTSGWELAFGAELLALTPLPLSQLAISKGSASFAHGAIAAHHARGINQWDVEEVRRSIIRIFLRCKEACRLAI